MLIIERCINKHRQNEGRRAPLNYLCNCQCPQLGQGPRLRYQFLFSFSSFNWSCGATIIQTVREKDGPFRNLLMLRLCAVLSKSWIPNMEKLGWITPTRGTERSMVYLNVGKHFLKMKQLLEETWEIVMAVNAGRSGVPGSFPGDKAEK